MDKRLFLWGLSAGAIVLALAGAFWIGLGIGMAAKQHAHWAITAIGTPIQVGVAVALIRPALRLRRQSGFQRAELRRFTGVAEAQRRHIVRWMLWTTIAEAVLCALAAWMCAKAGAEDLFGPAIGVVVSLHFIPLAKIFHVRTYYATAALGTIVSLVGFVAMRTVPGTVAFGASMAAVMWGSAVYILLKADRIADRACAEHWVG